LVNAFTAQMPSAGRRRLRTRRPRSPNHLRGYINVQSIQPVKFTEFVRKAPGKFDARVMSEVKAALKRWLKL
jgi:mRNA-degrading endonuclease toxin of MazEF toxin-antitoxin module